MKLKSISTVLYKMLAFVFVSGTRPEDDDVFAFTSAGLSHAAIIHETDLMNGATYYVSVRGTKFLLHSLQCNTIVLIYVYNKPTTVFKAKPDFLFSVLFL